VLAQRLARRVCAHCRVQRSADARDLAELGLPPQPVTAFEGAGCARCDGSGYRGRLGVFELLTVGPRIRELILRRSSADLIRDAGRQDGMSTLAQDAWRKVRGGETSLDEVRPLLSLLSDDALVCRRCGHELRRGFRFCVACGTAVRTRCGCGAALEDGWLACPRCGHPSAHPP
jgi:hypothetical protein